MLEASKLMLGDCLERMREIPDQSVDMVLCDLPYGTTQNKWDAVLPLDRLWAEYWRVCRGAVVLTGSMPFSALLVMSNVATFKQHIVWDKCMPTGHLNAKKKMLMRHEDVLLFSQKTFGNFVYNPEMRKGVFRNKQPARKADANVRSYGRVTHRGDVFNNDYYPTTILTISNANQKDKEHPTQKPVPLFEYLVRTYTNVGATVLDNCMGSGTTGVACANSGRRFVGIERDEGYFAVAERRIREAESKAFT